MKKILALILVLITINCEAQKPPKSKYNAAAAYNKAVKLSMVAGPEYNIDTLVTITANNPLIQWKTVNGQKCVLFASFTSQPLAFATPQQPVVFNNPIWMFVPKQMTKRLGHSIKPKTNVLMRLSQMLGLPPVNGDTSIVEIWVPVDSVYRPAGDTSITKSKVSGTLSQKLNNDNSPSSYKNWFNANIIASYYAPLAKSTYWYYPWTRMGYTYDWAPGGNRVGVSEFLLKANSNMYIEKVYWKAADFFKKTAKK